VSDTPSSTTEPATAASVIRRIVAPAPHIVAALTCREIMLWVIGALLPSALWAVWNMGTPAIITFLASIVGCVATEWAWNAVTKRPQSIGDLSAVLTGMLLAMSVPPRTPWWICLIGGIVAIGLAKMLFGGLGFNIFNPALVGRAVVMMSWLGVMSEVKPWPGGWYNALKIDAVDKLDAINGATRLAIASADRAANGGYGYSLSQQYGPLLFKNLEGSLGEVSAALLILGGLVLLVRGIIDWRIPVGYIGSVALLSWAFGSDPVFNVLAGGVLLGAFFMATDYVTSPITRNGKLAFGIGCGVFNVVTRFFGPMPETTTFAILFMNGLAPLIDRMFLPKPFGWVKPAKAVKADA
jgi:electron transport complex protein RnfD